MVIVATVEPVFQPGHGGGVEIVKAGEDGDVESLGVVRAVVYKGYVVRDARVVDEADVPRVAFEFVEDGDLGGVEVEAFEVVDH